MIPKIVSAIIFFTMTIDLFANKIIIVIMSREYLNEFLDKLAKTEGCDKKQGKSCDFIGEVKKKVNKVDLRTKKGQNKVHTDLLELSKLKDCNFCDMSDSASLDLANMWDKEQRKKD